ncbi:MAG: hypothetical protein OEY13_05755 [Gammaproteobacteria bacterium]|nr:hypothetical protein [Gammaproteobacteria bacterium]MDH4311678.1 hypothetical protein [Gammaproteobacteria bacterium]MDH5272563.1 hypothetical protein [Gammaproteobacteria bacterium]
MALTKHKLVAILAAGLLAVPMAAQAAPTLDQANEYPFSGFAQIAGEYRAQTFTVGITGTLSRFEVGLFGVGATGNAVFEIWNTTATGEPAAVPGTALASATISFSGVDHAFVGADLTPGIPVRAGDVLAIVLKGGSSQLAYWDNTGDLYPSGSAFTTATADPTGPWISFGAFVGPRDFNFRTYVDVTPATLLQTLHDDVTGFGPAGILEKTVAQAQVYYAVPDIQATCAVMRFFDYEVRVIWRLSMGTRKPASWKITTAQMDDWLGQSGSIQSALGCY